MSKFDVKEKAHLIAKARGDAPEGQICWTMRLLDDRLVEDTLLDETTRRALKNESKPRLGGEGSTTTVSSEFVAAMEIKDGFMNSCRFVVDLISTAKDLGRDQDGSTSSDPA